MTDQPIATRIPGAALYLGIAGVVPFTGIAALILVGRQDVADAGTLALLGYGAVILSFLGGVQWGLAIVRDPPTARWLDLSISVIPSLVGWGTLFLRPQDGLLILAAAFVSAYFWDRRMATAGDAPGWYPKLRLPLTVSVVACLVVAALA